MNKNKINKFWFGLNILVCVLFFTNLTAQNQSDVILSNAQGLKQGANIYYELEGYDAVVKSEPEEFNEHGLFILRNRMEIDKEIKPTTDSTLSVKNKIYTNKISITKDIPNYNVYYFLENNFKKIDVVIFSVAGARNKDVERAFVKAVISGGVLDKYIDSLKVDSINFIGRGIKVPNGCRWMSPHNYQCPYIGQMSWSQYRNREGATFATALSKKISQSKKLVKVLEEKEEVLLFEGIETNVLKCKYKMKVPKVLNGGSNILIVYYVTQEVRGKFVSCILSYYETDANAGKLPYLLSQVMQLK
jgi:hypothetical protein